MEIVPYGGWHRCARFENGGVELIVTLDVGPRIIHLGVVGGPNELAVHEKDRGKTGGSEYRSYGGHRLWIAPEELPKTTQPDNDPVEHREEDGWHVFLSSMDAFHLRKEIRVRARKLLPQPPPPPGHKASRQGEGAFEIDHRIINEGLYAVQLAPWALTVMAPGGECLFPQEPFVEQLLPVRPLVLWGYTDMSDPRWTWGRRLIRLRQTDDPKPQKCGMMVKQGWAAYANHGNLFLKRFGFDPAASYPDYGCNFETYTRHDMLEVESLGPLTCLAPGAYVSHREAWYLLPNIEVPDDDDAAAELLEGLAADRPL